MLFDPKYELCNTKHEEPLEALQEQLRRAHALTPDLISHVIVNACTRLPAVKATRIDQLIEAGAWRNAALALIELELPAWKLRSLVYENGEWFWKVARDGTPSDEMPKLSQWKCPYHNGRMCFEIDKRLNEI